jgi:hypothetical protein
MELVIITLSNILISIRQIGQNFCRPSHAIKHVLNFLYNNLCYYLFIYFRPTKGANLNKVRKGADLPLETCFYSCAIQDDGHSPKRNNYVCLCSSEKTMHKVPPPE